MTPVPIDTVITPSFATPTDSIPDDFGELHFGSAQLGDRRRTKRLVDCTNRIVRRPDQTLPHKLQTPAALDAFYRLMNCPDVTHQAVLAPHRQRTLEVGRQLPGVVLMIHDSTELDYTSKTSLTTLGQIGNGKRRGYICHNSLAVDGERGELLGLANQILHHRRKVPTGETPKARQQRKDRESRLWVHAVVAIGPRSEHSPERSPEHSWIHVADRGGDTFEALETFHKNGGFLVRSNSNRIVQGGHGEAGSLPLGSLPEAHNSAWKDSYSMESFHGQKVKLHNYARSLPRQASKTVRVKYRPADKKGRTRRLMQAERTTEVSIGFAPVRLKPPTRRRGEHGDDPIDAWILHVVEAQPVPKGTPLEWFLLTDQPVRNAEDALRAIEWYERRWIIEEFHKAQKTGCCVEKVQFTKEEALKPTIALLSVVSVFLLTLRDLARRPDAAQRKATDVVDPMTVEELAKWRQGKKAWHAWNVLDFVMALGRLGGHQNRKGDGLPGWITLWRGWQELQAMLVGAGQNRKPVKSGQTY